MAEQIELVTKEEKWFKFWVAVVSLLGLIVAAWGIVKWLTI